MFQTYLAVMAGGAIGASARMFVSMWMASHYGESFPWGTFAANVLGCFIIGIFGGLTGPEGTWLISPVLRQLVMVGILGGFTTYSSFSLQTIQLFSDGKLLYAFANISGTLLLCLLGTWGGLAIAGMIADK
jgi:CrcB protein